MVRKGSSPNFASNIKGYLRYKMMTSQNVSSETQVKNFLKFHRKVMLCSQETLVSVFSTISFLMIN